MQLSTIYMDGWVGEKEKKRRKLEAEAVALGSTGILLSLAQTIPTIEKNDDSLPVPAKEGLLITSPGEVTPGHPRDRAWH